MNDLDKIVVVSGYFNPLHTGHLDYLEGASQLGNRLVVIVNNDHQVGLKGSESFMPLAERLKIVGSLRCVSRAVPSIDRDGSVSQTLKSLFDMYLLQNDKSGWGGTVRSEESTSSQAIQVSTNMDYLFDSMLFANGGDRKLGNIPEYEICEKLGVEMIFNVGGGKTQSSSSLLGNVVNENK